MSKIFRKVVEQTSKTNKLKFIQAKNRKKVVFNEKLIEKTKKILGIKGYYTNLSATVADNKIVWSVTKDSLQFSRPSEYQIITTNKTNLSF
ncbi:MAG: hypothetical protein PHI70_05515 [Proteiniphilum sp.]|nr:hypothetical protein [Proteiniphilum sp.]MDD4416223.1 hypothetical protein [Proteiniphilum sp.]